MPQSSRRTDDPTRRRPPESTAQRHQASLRKKRIVAIVVAAALVLSTVAGVIAAATSSPDSSTTDTTAPSPTTTPPVPATGVEPVAAPPGAALDGPTPCPPDDGSATRTTSFAEPPPLCIDPDRFYRADVTTSAGPLTFQLNPARAPESVNAFVVLARYGYYDGAPVTRIEPRGWIEAGGLFTEESAETGFAIADEVPAEGQLFTPGTIAMRGAAGTPGSNRGALLVATYENAPAIDEGVSSFGVLLDGAPTLAAIDAAASTDGLPTRPITIEAITITEGDPIG